MKSKLKAVAVACLLALQLFSSFVPCLAVSAEESGTAEDHVSFSQTTIYADLVDPNIYAEGKTAAEIKSGEQAAAATLLEKYPLDASRGTADASVITSTVEKTSSGYSAFFYVYIPGGTESVLSAAFTLEGGDKIFYRSALQISMSDTLVKYRIDFNRSEYESFRVGDDYELSIRLFEITYRGKTSSSNTNTVAYNALQQTVNGGELTSGLLFSYASDGKLKLSTVEETLRLDVHMAQERYSQTNAALWYQLNTAYFIVPHEYFYHFNRIYSIDYQYKLLSDVPMLVSTDRDFMEKAKEYEQLDFALQSNDWLDFPPGRAIINKILGNEVNVGPYFRFTVDELSTAGDGRFDVDEDTIWQEYNRAYDFAKRLYNGDPKFLYAYVFGKPNSLLSFDYKSWQSKFHQTVSFEYFFIVNVLKLPYDLYSVENFATKKYSEIVSSGDSASSEGLWDRLMDGRLLDKIDDDSIEVPVIQNKKIGYLIQMTDAEICDEYCIDMKYIPELRSALQNASEDDYIVFFHCIETYYYAWPPDYIWLFDWFDSEVMLESQGYFVLNTFILDFNIINLNFNEGEVSVPVIHESVNFVGGLESSGSMYDEISDDNGYLWDLLNLMHLLLKIAAMIGAMTIVVAAFYGIVWLVDKTRDAFGKRGGGG